MYAYIYIYIHRHVGGANPAHSIPPSFSGACRIPQKGSPNPSKSPFSRFFASGRSSGFFPETLWCLRLGTPLSSEDYLALIRGGLHTFVVSDVPRFDLKLHNEAGKRDQKSGGGSTMVGAGGSKMGGGGFKRGGGSKMVGGQNGGGWGGSNKVGGGVVVGCKLGIRLTFTYLQQGDTPIERPQESEESDSGFMHEVSQSNSPM